jgi:hypothetical protein
VRSHGAIVQTWTREADTEEGQIFAFMVIGRVRLAAITFRT